MNIGEANAVNVVIRALLDETYPTTPHSGSEAARIRDASIFLAGQANKVLHAGLTPVDIEREWPV